MQLVSVIIPVYNSLDYLARCLNSVISQSYNDLEIILIDDGATDGSALICDEYASKDERVKVIHKKNEGVSTARNIGIEHSHGEWIAFVDSDDWLDSDYISTLVINSEDVDIVICNCSQSKEYKGIALADFVQTEVKTFPGTACHQKIIKSSLIKGNGVRFSQRFKFGEDTLFSLDLLQYCNGIKLLNYQGYHVNQSEELVSEKYNQTVVDLEDKIEALREIHEKLGIRFNKKFDITYDIRMTIMMFPMEKILNGSDKEYEQLWMSYFPDSSISNLYNDRNCSPLIRSITLMKYLSTQKKMRELYSFIQRCYSLWGNKYLSINYPYSFHCKIAYLIGAHHLLSCWTVLLLYSKLKRRP